MASIALGDRPAHLIGWSLGAAPVLQFALDYPQLARSLVLVNPISPYGFGGTQGLDGAPNYDDFAGSGPPRRTAHTVRRRSRLILGAASRIQQRRGGLFGQTGVTGW